VIWAAQRVSAGVVLALSLLLLAACGAASYRVSTGPVAVDPMPAGLSTDDAFAELDALPAPAGVDAALWSEMKSALADGLITGTQQTARRFASAPPQGASSRVLDLALTDDGGGNFSLTWGYRNGGDYDQNGTVGVADLTPLAQRFGNDASDPDSAAGVADGDGNGAVGISDVTPIAMNFGAVCASYRVQGLTSPGTWVDVGTVLLSAATAGPERRVFSYVLGTPAHEFYRVVPFDGQGAGGTPSGVAPSSGAPPPNIVSAGPRSGMAGEYMSFSAEVEGAEPLSYVWDFGGGADPNGATVADPVVTLGAEGEYAVTLTVANATGSDSYSFTLGVTPPGTPPVVNSVAPSGGYSGSQINMAADVDGDEPLAYEWTFGGGATPNESSDATPTITLGEPGKYFCTLQVSNQWGYAPFYQFELWVYATGGTPVTITGVQPLEARSGRETVFSVTTTGNEPDYFLWDFGGGADPNIAYWETPSVVPGAVGTYDASVTVGNLYGPADVYEFTLTVVEDTGWPVDPVKLDWLESWYLPLPPLSSSARVFQTAEYRQWADELLALINAERTAAGVGAVAFEPHLEALGTAHCRHMATVGFFGHTNPQGMSPVDRLDCVNPPLYAFPGLTHGENIAAGQTSPEQVISEWMDSTMHRYNLLHAPWTHVGIGIYYNGSDSQGYKTYWATEFIQLQEDPNAHNWIEPGDTPP